MHCYFAAYGNTARMGSLNQCFGWAEDALNGGHAKIVKIMKARPREKNCRIVFEVTKDGIQETPNGRIVNLHRLRIACDDV